MTEHGQCGADGPDPWVASTEQAPYQVRSIRRRTPTIVELRLSPPAEPLVYRPGQYILLEDDRAAVAPRSYSIANAPRPGGEISLLITRVPGGQGSTWIHERLAIGEQVLVSGPYGSFVDDPASTAPMLLLAAGSGLAPIRALLEGALAESLHPELTLVFSARREADVIDGQNFARLQRREPRFRFIRTLTGEAGLPPRGRIPATLATLVGDLADHDVFVAGAPDFVIACAGAAEALGTTRARLQIEAF